MSATLKNQWVCHLIAKERYIVDITPAKIQFSQTVVSKTAEQVAYLFRVVKKL